MIVALETSPNNSLSTRASALHGILHGKHTSLLNSRFVVSARASFDYQKKEMISYDNEQVGRWKGDWIRREQLRGSMFWELSGDKQGRRDGIETGPGKDPQPGPSIVTVVKEAMGGLDLSPSNWLRYEGSKYNNMKNGMQ